MYTLTSLVYVQALERNARGWLRNIPNIESELRRINPAAVRETFLQGRPRKKDEATWLNDVTKHAGGTAGEKTFTETHKMSMATFYLKGEW